MSEKRPETEDSSDSFIGKTIFNKYLLMEKIGEGAFGFVCKAKSINSNKLYAVKFENITEGQFILEEEALFLSYLNCNRIPKVKSFGYSDQYIVLVMELLGKSLDKILNELPTKKMSVRCICNIAIQLISIFEIIHSNHIVHRDIKPSNIAIGLGNNCKYIYVFDFGLSKKYRSSTTKKHIPFTQDNILIGNARYSSINALEGGTQSRRDDLESIGYLLIYLLLGTLPWEGKVSHSKEDKFYKIREIKKNTTPEELCQGLPKEFEEYIKYTRNLEYESEPDYDYLKDLFSSVLKKGEYDFDYYYDWDNITFQGNDNSLLNNIYINNYITIHKMYSKILELEKERKVYGGFELERFVFDIEEESNFNILKRNNEKDNMNDIETTRDIYSYSNSMTPYAYPQKKVKNEACFPCQTREYREEDECCKIW